MMKRILIALALVLSSLPAYGQGTTMPIPLAQWFDNNGAVLTSGGLCVFRAGTSTAASTYTTAALTVPNTNPILFSSGRATSGGVFLTPGESYKFELRDYAATVGSPTCAAGVGATIWTVDSVTAVPNSAASVDVPGVAGEAIAAGDAVWMYAGDEAGALNAGQWYRTDSDLTTYSTRTFTIGMAPSAIASGATGSIRINGAVTLTGPLSVGAPYYVSATPGVITTTPPVNAIRLGQAQSTTVLILGRTAAPVSPKMAPCGRLTLTTGVPVTTADVTAAGTVFYAPYGGCNQIELFTAASWATYAFAQISIAVPAVANQMYDVFAYDNLGVVTLELTAWTNDTTRATALTTQNGVYVKTAALDRRYLGSFRTLTASQTEDSVANRLVWNYYNRRLRLLTRTETNSLWVYNSATIRQARASTLNQVALVIGVTEDLVQATYSDTVDNDNATSQVHRIGIGLDSTTAYATGSIAAVLVTGPPAQMQVYGVARFEQLIAVGYHTIVMLEASTATATSRFFGAQYSPGSGLRVMVWG